MNTSQSTDSPALIVLAVGGIDASSWRDVEEFLVQDPATRQVETWPLADLVDYVAEHPEGAYLQRGSEAMPLHIVRADDDYRYLRISPAFSDNLADVPRLQLAP